MAREIDFIIIVVCVLSSLTVIANFQTLLATGIDFITPIMYIVYGLAFCVFMAVVTSVIKHFANKKRNDR